MTIQVIMPVGLDPEFEKKLSIIRELATQYNIEIRVPLPDATSVDFDLKELINQFRKATSVIADLSYERPSCYYELGIAETLKKDVQIIASSGTAIHQTSHKSSVLFYSNLIDYEYIVEKQMRRDSDLPAET